MIRLITVTVLLMFMLIFLSCFATMTPQQRKETYDLRENVGNAPFVGDTSPEARYFADPQMYGPSGR